MDEGKNKLNQRGKISFGCSRVMGYTQDSKNTVGFRAFSIFHLFTRPLKPAFIHLHLVHLDTF